MISVTIDGRSYSAEENTTILNIAKANDIYIPTLCYLEGVSDIGSCRLCVVEVEGFNAFLPACRTKAKDGMVIKTDSEQLLEYRRDMLKLILSNHNQDCMSCPANGTCELQDPRGGAQDAGRGNELEAWDIHHVGGLQGVVPER